MSHLGLIAQSMQALALRCIAQFHRHNRCIALIHGKRPGDERDGEKG